MRIGPGNHSPQPDLETAVLYLRSLFPRSETRIWFVSSFPDFKNGAFAFAGVVIAHQWKQSLAAAQSHP
jgi:hypothetical protein